jgi:flagellin
MRDLAVQASNTGSQDATARAAASTEFTQLSAELDRIGNTTKFGSSNLLDGTFGTQAGVAKGAGVPGVTIDATHDQFGLAVDGGSAVNLTLGNKVYTNDAAGAASLQTDLQTAIDGNASLKGLVSASAQFDTLTGNVVVNFTRNSTATGTSVAVSAGAANSALGNLGFSGTTTGTATAGTGGRFQVGANNGNYDHIDVSIAAVSSSLVSGVDLNNNAAGSIGIIDNAITSVSTTRANLGAYQNRFEHTISNLSVAAENLSASESRIRDTDMASEMVSFTRAQILTQAGTAMLAQANQAPQQVLQLLRG